MIAGAIYCIIADGVAMHLAVAVQTYTISFIWSYRAENCCPQGESFTGIHLTTKNK